MVMVCYSLYEIRREEFGMKCRVKEVRLKKGLKKTTIAVMKIHHTGKTELMETAFYSISELS